ncbi:hypothetical protein Dsin_001444 [Dipteronia sinensis]|uniref:Cytochrome P450 n=1 Tax=Dipteronia sinensis TaxID=43782 RepID=A0AAE0B4S7_9ROSI|nr:hypothetical protein Dsin_001444 [Dipteronia sinensis]
MEELFKNDIKHLEELSENDIKQELSDNDSKNEGEDVVSYVDTLLDLQLPEENIRKLEESEMVALCSEFLDGGTDTTSTALQWIMANLVKYPQVQEKLFMEMIRVLGDGEEEGDKDMPFDAGRRICPGYNLAMIHLEYFVANLVWKFQWKSVEGDDVDLAEKQEFTTFMKYPLQVHLSPRVRRQ